MFPADPFGDAARNILLNLCASYPEKRRKTIIGVIPWPGYGRARGNAERISSSTRTCSGASTPLDARRKFMLLSPNALRALNTELNLKEREAPSV